MNIEEINQLLEKVLAQPKQITQVVGGPFEQDNKIYWRITDDKIAELSTSLIGDKKAAIKIGLQVVVIGSAIVGVLPTELHLEEKQADFKKISWDNVGGLKSQIERIRDAVELPINNPSLYKEYGLPPLKGLLLYGPPGCGKTLIAKVIASYILGNNGHFVYLKGGELLSPLVGAAENAIKQHFEKARIFQAKHKKRAVIFIDEAEALLPIRGSRISDSVNETVVPTFLAEMDGFEENSPFVILSTNLPNSLDEAILRAGRIDLKIEVERPTEDDAHEIFEIHLNKTLCSSPVKEMAAHGVKAIFQKHKSKVSGSLIELIVKQAAQIAIKRSIADKKCIKGVTTKDVIESITKN